MATTSSERPLCSKQGASWNNVYDVDVVTSLILQIGANQNNVVARYVSHVPLSFEAGLSGGRPRAPPRPGGASSRTRTVINKKQLYKPLLRIQEAMKGFIYIGVFQPWGAECCPLYFPRKYNQ